MNNNLAPHEILNIQELLNSNILETKMITNNISTIKDENLKQLMQEHLTSKMNKLKEIEDFINANINQNNNQQGNTNGNNSAQ